MLATALIVSAELSVNSHFVWQPGVRREGNFKSYFGPKQQEEKSAVNIQAMGFSENSNSKKTSNKKEAKLTSCMRSRNVAVCLYTPGSPKDPYIHVITVKHRYHS